MRLLVALLLLTACVVEPVTSPAIMTWDDLSALPERVPDRKIAYGADPLQIVEIWLPKGEGPYPVVLMLHGGCWKTDIADLSIMNSIAHDLRERGIAVWNVEYRGVDRAGGGYPGTYEDVAAALTVLRTTGARYRLKTDRLVALGHSAGGHLALWLANRPAIVDGPLSDQGGARVDTAISLGGLPDLQFSSNTTGHGCGTEGARAMAGSPPDYTRTSPIAMVPGPARQVQINASADRIAPPSYAAAYREALAAKGGAVEMVTIEDEGHVELIAPGTRAWAAAVAQIEAALKL